MHLANGLPSFTIVGLPEAEVKEARDRVRAALQNARFEFPARRITVNLAPADLPKESGRFDLPIALGILAASGQIPAESARSFRVRRGARARGRAAADPRARSRCPRRAACAAARSCCRVENAAEAALVEDADVYPARHLLAGLRAFHGRRAARAATLQRPSPRRAVYADLAGRQGQAQAQARARRSPRPVATACSMIGPPGTGKTMLASRLPGILPPMTQDEALASAAHAVRSADTASMCATGGSGLIARRTTLPRRSRLWAAAAIRVRAKSRWRCTACSSWTSCPEFDRRVLEVLREPLESGRVSVSRAARQAEFPARVPARRGDESLSLRLSRPLQRPVPLHARSDSRAIARRISGPLLDRIDLQIEVPAVPVRMRSRAPGERER